MKKLILLLAVMMLLVGCGKEEPSKSNDDAAAQNGDTTEDTATVPDEKGTGFSFDYNGSTLQMNKEAAPVVEALGDPLDYFESESCAFKGLDKVYYYSGFELTTYPLDDVDYISTIDFKDDTVSTKEGIFIGSSLDDVKAAYGEDYKEENGFYTYTKGDSTLTFIMENDAVTAITYTAIVEGTAQ